MAMVGVDDSSLQVYQVGWFGLEIWWLHGAVLQESSSNELRQLLQCAIWQHHKLGLHQI